SPRRKQEATATADPAVTDGVQRGSLSGGAHAGASVFASARGTLTCPDRVTTTVPLPSRRAVVERAATRALPSGAQLGG
ncbi:MAG: hypothetical protein ACXWZZ_05920, partial [Solirubrobacteraceae bacterium]